jgi:hypothetical protein
MRRCLCRTHLRRADRKPWVLAVDGLRQHGVHARVEVVWFKIEVRSSHAAIVCGALSAVHTCALAFAC